MSGLAARRAGRAGAYCVGDRQSGGRGGALVRWDFRRHAGCLIGDMRPSFAALALLAVSLPSCTHPVSGAPFPSPEGSPELHVGLTNQSPDVDPLEVSVRVDGVSIFEGALPYEGGVLLRSWSLRVPPGAHVLDVESPNGGASLHETFETGAQPEWALVSYWRDGGSRPNGPASARFDWSIDSREIALE